MTPANRSLRLRDWLLLLLVTAAAAILAVAGTRPYASSWNDGSRLATVECLVERGTLRIEHSIYVYVPSARDPTAPNPYDPGIENLQGGTGDRIYVGGHFYSHKSPVPAVLMAGLYAALRHGCGVVAAERPGLFATSLSIATSGVAYVAAVVGVFLLAGALGLAARVRLLLAAGFAFSTTALAYSLQVNDHVLLLALAVWLLFGMTRLIHGRSSSWLLAGLGSLGGLSYAVEMGSGPILCAATGLLVMVHCRRIAPVMVFALAALPWIGLHHALNWSIGGTIIPAASVPEFFHWPGSPFTEQNMTGNWKHDSLMSLVMYSGELLVGRRGFFTHNITTAFVVPSLLLVAWRRIAERPIVLVALAWSLGTWLLYAGNSNNYSGSCCSIRWLVPVLGPAFYLTALLLREREQYAADFAWVALCAAPVAFHSWWQGPWQSHNMVGLRAVEVAALLGCIVIRWRAWRRRLPIPAPIPQPMPVRKAA